MFNTCHCDDIDNRFISGPNPDLQYTITLYGDGLNPQHDTREKVLAKFLRYCEYNHTKKIQRNDLVKICKLPPATFTRAINWAERQGAIQINDKTIPGQTWIKANFRTAERVLLRTIKRNAAQNFPVDRVAVVLRAYYCRGIYYDTMIVPFIPFAE